MKHFCIFVGKTNIFKTNCEVFALEISLRLFQRRVFNQLFQFVNFVTQLGDFSGKTHCFQSGGTDRKRHAKHQNKISQGTPPLKDKPAAHRQRKQRHTRDNARIQRHPWPAYFVPVQCKIPIGRNIIFKAGIALAVTVEHLNDLHAVNVLNNGIIHFCSGNIVRFHFCHTRLKHHAHGKHSDGKCSDTQQCHLPVHKEHGANHKHRDQQIGDSFRNGVCQQKFDGFNIIGKHLLDTPVAIFTDCSKRLSLHFLLKGNADIFQSVICTDMGIAETLYIQ